jgi:ABC-2 type transport system ATP-binding protein
MPEDALLLRGVSHRFGDLEALSRVDLRVGDGDIYGFLGLNGAGKTTLIRLIVGLIRPRSGEISVLGSPVRGRPPEPFRQVGVLFEDFAAPLYLTGWEHLYLQARFLGRSRNLARKSAGHWLSRVRLESKAAVKIRNYSMGMRRRLGIATALVADPRLVILDEPTNGLDPQGIAELRSLILELNRDSGVTFFLSSHILGEVEQLCERVGILHRGRMALEGKVGDLTGRERSLHKLRASPPDKALEILRAAPWSKGVERVELDAASAAAASSLLQVEVSEADVPRMVRELVSNGVDVHEVTRSEESLESVFHRILASGVIASGASGGAIASGGAGAGGQAPRAHEEAA